MSGKGAGKKRNRAAQSEQHGYQEPQADHATKPGAGEYELGSAEERAAEKQRIIDKLRQLEERQKEQRK